MPDGISRDLSGASLDHRRRLIDRAWTLASAILAQAGRALFEHLF